MFAAPVHPRDALQNHSFLIWFRHLQQTHWPLAGAGTVVETFAAESALAPVLPLLLAASAKIVNDFVPCPFGNFRVVCSQVSFGQCDAQDRTISGDVTGITDAFGPGSVASVQTFFASCFGVLQGINTVSFPNQNLIFIA